MIRLGILDFDTSHCVEFTSRLNHAHSDPEQWVHGARVVIGCPGESKLSPERIPGFTEEMQRMKVPLVDRPEEMIGKVDGMLIESSDGSVHFERVRPFLEAGIPCFVDKPFACSLADAQKIADLAARKGVAIFSSSAMRYAPELVTYLSNSDHALVSGIDVHGPARLHQRNPGLFHYGIHAVEILFAMMGSHCESVACMTAADADIAAGRWKDRRIGSVRGMRKGPRVYGATVFGENEVHFLSFDKEVVYRELLKRIVQMFETGRAPLDIAITLEIVAFIEAALESAGSNGAETALAR